MNRRQFLGAIAAAFSSAFTRKTKAVKAPAGPWKVRVVSPEGVSVRMVRSYSPDGIALTRLDVLYGVNCRPDIMCRVEG